MMRPFLVVPVLVGIAFLFPGSTARSQDTERAKGSLLPIDSQWGTLNGEVLWADEKIPPRRAVPVGPNQAACLANGAILEEKFVIDPKNRGVRWVTVWLVHAKDEKRPLPVHPDLKEVKIKNAVINLPCCAFEPHVLAMREGQTLVVKNRAAVAHHVVLASTGKNPNLNELLPAGTQKEVTNWFEGRTPTRVECTVHPWMSASIWVFNHPYFAVTDANGKFVLKNAPAGNHHLVVWHEEIGFVKNGRKGIPVTIPKGGVGQVKIDLKSNP